ncbi:GntR family transcriptional regulator [Quadrisphaera granulorum]|uniref:GntR family transcriptional regulator n=1 Tax=Quadrisphaera granulorum TaxID=317664 RepID=A0A315ZRH2_9ACTN|nr:GntR family transcriptional regulator [Quadrisphaera granulorum]PWJ47600.1 GntR family transcriptional regulator [Quadrisphaera granulorum]SZE98730.1 GntR family transcriptional regulator [Quadrisphaera granulorum]
MAGSAPPGVAAEVYNAVLEAVSTGQFAAGSRLPGERALAERLGVSRATLRLGLAALEDQGFLERSAQRGWFVPQRVLGEPPSTLLSFTEMARARGLRPTAKVLRQEVRPAGLEEAEKLRIAPAAAVVQIDRLRGMDQVPVCFDVVVVPVNRAPALVDANLEDASLYQVLREQCGIDVFRSAYALTAANADAALARLLGVNPGAAVLVGDEVAYEQNGAPVLIGSNRYRGDAYRFEADLFRSHPDVHTLGGRL